MLLLLEPAGVQCGTCFVPFIRNRGRMVRNLFRVKLRDPFHVKERFLYRHKFPNFEKGKSNLPLTNWRPVRGKNEVDTVYWIHPKNKPPLRTKAVLYVE